ncbi:MAG: hypothetical protein LBF40_09350 [Deltaproteobacteria bacterium]|jgi:hypothetical protein|nr:hypothetical protein [Deltaproteobacteria bacterium]
MMAMDLLGRLPRGWKLAALTIILFAGFVYLGAHLMGGAASVPRSDASGLATDRVEGAVGAEGTPEYNRMLEEDNMIRADEARKSGESYVAVPVGSLSGWDPPAKRPATEETGKDPAVAPEAGGGGERPALNPQPMQAGAVRPRPAGRAGADSPKPDNKGMLGALKGLLDKGVGAPVVGYTGITFEKAKEAARKEAFLPNGPADGLRPGDILQATSDLPLDSDSPSPAMATIVEGPLKGARVMGSFKAQGHGLLISFTKLVAKDGTETKIEAYGVDPRARKALLSSSVDTHFLRRWGGLIASSFLEGFGKALSTRGRRVYVTGDTVVEESLGKGMGDSAYEAMGKVGERAADQFGKGFDTPPTIRLRAGEPIGILIIAKD